MQIYIINKEYSVINTTSYTTITYKIKNSSKAKLYRYVLETKAFSADDEIRKHIRDYNKIFPNHRIPASF